MKLPDSLNRKAVKRAFPRVADATWEYLFDHEKENGLVQCRAESWSAKIIFYRTDALKQWLVARCYYLPEDFEAKEHRRASPWAALVA